jgi:hypothetical protein
MALGRMSVVSVRDARIARERAIENEAGSGPEPAVTTRTDTTGTTAGPTSGRRVRDDTST